MREHLDIWRQRPGLWLPALLFFLLNVGALVTYRVVFSDQGRVQAARVERGQSELAALQRERRSLEELVDQARTNQAGIREFYNQRLASEEKRLTGMIAEVKDLAAKAGLAPPNVSYDRDEFEDQGLVKRSMIFVVQGNYQAFRQLVNMLELSDSFLILEQVSLSESGEAAANLRINLKIASLFSEAQPASSVSVGAEP